MSDGHPTDPTDLTPTSSEVRIGPRFGAGLAGGLLMGVIGVALVLGCIFIVNGADVLNWILPIMLAPAALLALVFALQHRTAAFWGTITGGLLILATCIVVVMHAFAHAHFSM